MVGYLVVLIVMAGWAHLVLVGASIAANAFRDGLVSYDVHGLEKYLHRGEDLRKDLVDILLGYVENDCRRASAELNTCIDLIIEGYRSGRQQWCYLFSSDTEVGRLCSEVLAGFLKKFSSEKLDGRLAVLNPIIISLLGDPRKFNDGLANLFQKIVETISYHKKLGDSVFVHATGGFKPETAIAILAANMPMSGAPTFYVHEHFNQLVRIPAMPITFRMWRKFSDIMNYLLKFEKVDKEKCFNLYGRRAVIEAVKLGWVEEEDGFLKLTSFGRLLWAKMRR